MKTFLFIAFALTTFSALTPDRAFAQRGVCECREVDEKIKFFVAGKEIMDFGRWSNAPIDCAKHMAGQSYCGTACYQPVCKCQPDGNRTKFYVAGKEIIDFGSFHTGAIECAKHMAQQSYCK